MDIHHISNMALLQYSSVDHKYVPLEYLESTGSQWIDTGYVPAIGDSISVEFLLSSSDNMAIFSAGTGLYQTTLVVSGNSLYMRYFSSSPAPSFNGDFSTGVWYSFDVQGDGYATVNGSYHVNATPLSGVGANETMRVFCRANGTSFLWGKIRGFAVRDANGSLVRSLVPCIRLSDGKPGMYDACSSICPLTGTPFYINSGTGADFTYPASSP